MGTECWKCVIFERVKKNQFDFILILTCIFLNFSFSYNTVHLTLRYIYSGECDFSEIKNVAELSKLADMLCLEGLKDNIMLYLAAEYCHFFKEVNIVLISSF